MRGRERGGEETEKERVGQGIQGKMKKKKRSEKMNPMFMKK